MQLKDVTPIIKAILHERDKIPLTTFDDQHVQHANSMRGGIRKALRVIEQAPTIDAAPVVHARWIDPEGIKEYHCSKCDAEAPNEGYYCGANYCWDCGAKMDAE